MKLLNSPFPAATTLPSKKNWTFSYIFSTIYVWGKSSIGGVKLVLNFLSGSSPILPNTILHCSDLSFSEYWIYKLYPPWPVCENTYISFPCGHESIFIVTTKDHTFPVNLALSHNSVFLVSNILVPSNSTNS